MNIEDSPFNMRQTTTFIDNYIGALKWSSMVVLYDSDDGDGNFEYAHADEYDTTENFDQMCIADCINFLALNEKLVREALDAGIFYCIDRAGHDFALTRNRHGVGYCDRGLGDIGDELTEAAESFGEISLYINDDGLLCID